MIKTIQKNKIERILNERGGNKMYFIVSKKINNKKLEERKIRRDKIQKMWKQPKGNKYIKLYDGLCRYAIEHGNNMNYKNILSFYLFLFKIFLNISRSFFK